MPAREDFNSGSRSPGGWGGSGSGSSMGGMGGQKASNYNYYSGAGQRGPAVGNWNTGGVPVRTGNQYGTNPMGYSRQPFPGGYAPPVVQGPLPSLLGIPAPRALPPPAVTQEDIPGLPPDRPFTNAMNFRDAYAPTLSRPWGQYQTRPGTYPGQTGSNTTTIPYNPNGGGYTNIYKNNQGNLPGYPGGNSATYAGMGSDFRSIDSW